MAITLIYLLSLILEVEAQTTMLVATTTFTPTVTVVMSVLIFTGVDGIQGTTTLPQLAPITPRQVITRISNNM